MRRQTLSLVAVTFAVGCGDEPLNDESLLGPVRSSISSTGLAAVHPIGRSGDAVAAAGAAGAPFANSYMFWDHEKAALRAGAAERDEWATHNLGNGSFATGLNTIASFSYSAALGTGATASGFASTAIGKNTNATGDIAVALGEETTAQAFLSLVIGRWNKIAGTQVAWDDHDPLFVIGNGTDDTNRNDALVVRKEGDMELQGALVAGGDGIFSGDLRGDGLTLGDHAGQGMFTLCADNLGNVVDCASSLRYKRDVTDLRRGLPTVLRLRPRMFRWSDSVGAGLADLGFIAEEVATLDPLLATYGKDGTPSGVKYRHMTALLTKSIQDLSEIVETQNETISRQEQENRRLETRLADLESALLRLEQALKGE